MIRARCDIERSLQDSPSLRSAASAMILDELPAARKIVATTPTAYGEKSAVEVDGLTYTREQVIDEWFP